jgi:anti-sigma factor RsiW
MLKCRDILEQADAYLTGHLNVWQRLQFRVHLALCANCRRYLRQLKLTQQVSQQTVLTHQVTSQQINDVLTFLERHKD